MSIKLFAKDSAAIRETARIGDTGGRYLLRMIEARLERERENMETNPRFDHEFPANDLVYKLGFIAGLRWVLGVPDECLAILKQAENINER